MNKLFSTERTDAIQVGNDYKRWIEPLHEVYVSNREFMDLTNPPSDNYREIIEGELREAGEAGRLSLVIQNKKNEKTIGILEFWQEAPKDKKPWIGLFMLHKDYHRNGIGKEVIFECMRYIAHQNFQVVRIGVDLDNERGFRFWRALGFTTYDQKEILHPLGARMVYCMERDLSNVLTGI